MGGTIIGQLIGVLTLPIVTRLFDPEAFGIYGIYTAVIGIISVIVCFRYELAIIIPKDDNQAANLYWVSLISTLIWTVLSIFTIYIYGNLISENLNSVTVSNYLWFFPLGIFISGLYTTNSHWNTRKVEYNRLASVQVSNSTVNSGSKILFGLFGLTTGGFLIIGTIIGTIVATLDLGIKIWKKDKQILLKNTKIRELLYVIRKYKNISIFNSTSSLINSISQGAPLILLAYYYGPITAGFFVLGYKLLRLPVNLLGNSMKKVFFQRVSGKYDNDQDLLNFTKSVSYWLISVSVISMTLIVSLSGPLTPLLFGSDWLIAGSYIKWMALWVVVSFVSVPIGSIVTIKQKEHIGLLHQIFSLLLRISALYFGGEFIADPNITIMMYSFAGFLYNIIYMHWIFKLVGLSSINVLKDNLSMILLGCLCVSVSLILQFAEISIYITLACILLYISVIYKYYKVDLLTIKNIM